MPTSGVAVCSLTHRALWQALFEMRENSRMKFQPSQSLHPSKGRRKQADLRVRKASDKIRAEWRLGIVLLLGVGSNKLYDETLREA